MYTSITIHNKKQLLNYYKKREKQLLSALRDVSDKQYELTKEIKTLQKAKETKEDESKGV